MKETKSKYIKGRCTPEDRKQIDAFAQKNGIGISALVLSSVMAYIQSEEKESNLSSPFTEQVRFNIFRNKLLNTININPAIPDTVKENLYKEMMKF